MRSSLAITGTVAALALATSLVAQSQSGQGNRPTTQPSVSVISEQETIQGKVTDIRTFQVEGAKQPHVLAKIEVFGKPTIADLGPKAALDRQLGRQLQQGQEISVSGVPGRINGKPVLIARNVTPPQATAVTIAPFEPDITLFSFPVLAPTVEGRLTAVREVQDQSGKHVLADLKTPDGQTMVVDLGDGTAARQSLKLQQGDWIAATGIPGTVNGQQVLVADHVASVAAIEPSGGSAESASPAGATLGGQDNSSGSGNKSSSGQR